MLQLKNILIIGHKGFIGSNLINSLINTDFNVFYIDKKISDERGVEKYYELRNLDNFIDTNKIKCIINLSVKYVPVNHKNNYKEEYFTNLILPQYLIKLCFFKGITYLNFGTYLQYLKNVNSFYVNSKRIIQSNLENLKLDKNFRYVDLILNDTYGLGDTRKKLIYMIIDSISKSEIKLTEGKQLINYTYVDDICLGISQVLNDIFRENKFVNQTFSLRSSFIPVTDLASRVEEVVKKQTKIKWGAIPYRGDEVFENPELPQILPDWKPIMNLDNGINEIYKKTLKESKKQDNFEV